MHSTLSSGGQIFAPEQVERARRYHQPIYVVRVIGIVLGLVVLGLLAFSRLGDRLFELVDGLPWWGKALAFSALVTLVGSLVATPIAYWRGYVHERRWDFSTQTVGNWASDRVKGVTIGLVLTAITMLGLIASVRAFPSLWPLAAALGGAAVVFVVSFLAPVLLEPVFNKFAPLRDEQLAAELRALADRARCRSETCSSPIPVAGRGSTTPMCPGSGERAGWWSGHAARPRERAKYASSSPTSSGTGAFGSRDLDRGHDGRHTALFILGWGDPSVGRPSVGDRSGRPRRPQGHPVRPLRRHGRRAHDPAFALALSRRWERDADRFSLELTRDPHAYESTHRNLALSNLGDLDPPKAAYVFFFSHPRRLNAWRRVVRGARQA